MAAGPEPTPSLAIGGRPPPRGDRHPPRRDGLLKLIAAERVLRALVLLAIGVVLATHPHTDWGRTVENLARDIGFDPSRNGIQKLVDKVRAISPNKYVVFGVVAVGYGILEGVEGYGLWRRRRWAEYLTVVATSLLFVPEIYEIAKHATPFKVAALVVNGVIVTYLVWRLRHHE